MADKFIKDPDAVLDYQWDWESWLNGDTITEAALSVSPSGEMAVDSTVTADSTVTGWLSGGEVGTEYTVTCHVTAANDPAREDDRSIIISIKER